MANLSHGEIAGIVIGCVAGLLLVFALGFWCVRSRRRSQAAFATPRLRYGDLVAGAWPPARHYGEENAPARIWEVIPAPHGGQVGICYTSIL